MKKKRQVDELELVMENGNAINIPLDNVIYHKFSNIDENREVIGTVDIKIINFFDAYISDFHGEVYRKMNLVK